MIHKDNKKQQPKVQNFSLENFLGYEKKRPVQEQRRYDLTAPETDEKSAETEHTKPPSSNAKKTTSKPKKLTKEDYCGQFFKIPNTTASKGKLVYVRQEHHEIFNRLTNIMGINKLRFMRIWIILSNTIFRSSGS